MEKKEAIKALASVSTVIAATGLTSVANANQQEAPKTEVDALSSKVTVQALKEAENKQSVAVQAVNAQQDVVKQAITEEEKAEKTEAMTKEELLMKLRLSKTRPLLLKLIKLNKILVRQNQQSKIKMFNFRMLKLRLLKLKIKLTNKLKLLTVIKQRLLLKKLM